jgi:putative flippase GtrA
MEEIKKIVKFAIVGLMNSAVSYGTYSALLFFFHVPYLASLLLSWCIGITAGFAGHRYWTFRSRGDRKKEITRFLMINALFCLLNMPLLLFFVELVKLNPYSAQLLTMVILAAISYMANRFWIFRHSSGLEASSPE